MRTLTQHSRRTLVLIGVAATALLVAFFYFSTSDKTETLNAHKVTGVELFSPIESTTFGFPVSGIVEAKNAITVRAQIAGVVTDLIAEEGRTVVAGEPLLMQEVPLLGSRVALQDAQNGLSGLNQDSAYIARLGERERAQILSDAAKETTLLTNASAQTQTENSASLLATQIHGSVTGLVATLDFIDIYESYFDSKALKEFRETVGALYGNSRTYLTGSVMYGLKSHDDILELLDELTYETPYPDSTTLVGIAELVDAELDAARSILVDSESDFLDTKVVSPDDTLYTAYLTHRASVIEAQAHLRALTTAARVVPLSGTLSVHGAETEQALGGVGYMTAADIADNAARTVLQSAAVSEATLGVLREEASLGEPRAPFSGVVHEVFVNEGEYVTPGTPLLTLVGQGARELRVTVPHAMLPFITEGASFMIDRKVVGHVARFAPVLTGGSIAVFVELTDGTYTIGDVLRGEVAIDFDEKEIVAVPHAYVHFDAAGAFVRTESDTEVRVTITHDTGTILMVRPETPVTEPLRKAVGIAL